MSEPYREPPPDEGDQDIEVIASYSAVVDAEMAREYLKDHGIVAFAQESARFNPLVNVAAGGVRLLVSSRDAGRARHLISRMEKASTDEDDRSDDEVRCPRCELTYCFQESALSSARLSASAWSPLLMVLLLPLGLTRKRWRCHKCLHVWDDPKEGPRTRTPLHPDDPKPVLRLRRHRAGSGVLLGLVAMAFGGLALSGLGAPPPIPLVALALPVIGYFIGRGAVHDVCSEPSCRAPLAPGAKECRACRGAIAGVIRRAHEHYSEVAAVRRELFAIREEAEAKALPANKKPARKKKAAPKIPDAS